MKLWSRKWKSSKKSGKQRKYRHNAPLHVRHKLMAAHLSKELRKKYEKRSIPIRKGDKVKIMRGKFKNKTGVVEQVILGKYRIYIKDIRREKVDGTKVRVPFYPSNLMITELNIEDKKRLKVKK